MLRYTVDTTRHGIWGHTGRVLSDAERTHWSAVKDAGAVALSSAGQGFELSGPGRRPHLPPEMTTVPLLAGVHTRRGCRG